MEQKIQDALNYGKHSKVNNFNPKSSTNFFRGALAKNQAV